ncbi:MAG TPA: DinB family protein [Rhodothermales bacterium]|nr:DinB family protein [Rhodothermales bacterium]
MALSGDLVEAWRIHDRLHRYLLDAIPPAHLAFRAGVKGRTVGEVFAHIHNVRLMWLGTAAPERLEGLAKVEKDAAGDAVHLAAALAASGETIAGLLAAALESGRVKGFKPHPAAFFAYLVAHEAHHRGQVTQTLRLNGHPLDPKVAYGLWEWGVR